MLGQFIYKPQESPKEQTMTQKALLQSAGDGSAIPAGYVGEVKSITNSLTPVTTNWVTGSALLITKGVYIVTVFGSGAGNNGSRTAQSVGFSTDSSATTFSDQLAGVNVFQGAIATDGRAHINGMSIINVLSDTNYYLKALSFGANVLFPSEHIMKFIRIA